MSTCQNCTHRVNSRCTQHSRGVQSLHDSCKDHSNFINQNSRINTALGSPVSHGLCRINTGVFKELQK